MSTAYERSGRTHQKARTRAALVAAARSLVAQGGATPTVEEAAAAAAVSRTTAYRYFPSQTALLIAAHP
jgi:AcrR family transcriptional regulator